VAGLYIHIPFCAKRCLYCDFFSNTDMKFKEPYIDAAIREMELRQEYIGGEPLDTIYFGGGTPSQLQQADFERILPILTLKGHAPFRYCPVWLL
jgi:coproporphyrinogen III oxidase-like Fe-S oxidoreductase